MLNKWELKWLTVVNAMMAFATVAVSVAVAIAMLSVVTPAVAAVQAATGSVADP
jgi:hypothetical protein